MGVSPQGGVTKRLSAKTRALACKQFRALTTVVSQHVRLLGFFKTFTFSKTAANCFKLSTNQVFTTSNRIIMKNRRE